MSGPVNQYGFPRLVQRLCWKGPSSINSQTKFGDLFALEYMGYAEYEFGAFPSALIDMASHNLIHRKVTIGTMNLTVIHPDDYDAELADRDLLALYEGRVRTKGSSGFPPREYDQDTIGWFSLDDPIMWTTHSIAPTQIIAAIQRSSEYIKKQRAQRALLGGPL